MTRFVKEPCIRTPGGRRRFKQADLDAFIDSLRQGKTPTVTALQKLEQKVTVGRPAHSGVRDEPWFNRLDESQRSAMRTEGQQLMAMLMQYATRTNGGEAFLDEGQRWGAMLATASWLAIFPGLCITVTVTGFNLLGDGLRDILDPRRPNG